ncbi:hypothetical protein PT279_06590 [Bifidobacterium sp. ESL0784]|uniref:hypothetical protein n=1 Tax=Bifidobacterium sp. ESL0784 TaxID=2983231 RepID=UPI0023F88AD0|nr:hypothetical protein [Bifidobacterium sp. ESL0784]MDF7641255.1 hypothetical protein [Bifidobacterium sp. ESL0784]
MPGIAVRATFLLVFYQVANLKSCLFIVFLPIYYDYFIAVISELTELFLAHIAGVIGGMHNDVRKQVCAILIKFQRIFIVQPTTGSVKLVFGQINMRQMTAIIRRTSLFLAVSLPFRGIEDFCICIILSILNPRLVALLRVRFMGKLDLGRPFLVHNGYVVRGNILWQYILHPYVVCHRLLRNSRQNLYRLVTG